MDERRQGRKLFWSGRATQREVVHFVMIWNGLQEALGKGEKEFSRMFGEDTTPVMIEELRRLFGPPFWKVDVLPGPAKARTLRITLLRD